MSFFSHFLSKKIFNTFFRRERETPSGVSCKFKIQRKKIVLPILFTTRRQQFLATDLLTFYQPPTKLVSYRSVLIYHLYNLAFPYLTIAIFTPEPSYCCYSPPTPQKIEDLNIKWSSPIPYNSTRYRNGLPSILPIQL